MKSVNIHINRIEFVITHACSGKCKHCSIATDKTPVDNLNAEAAVRVIEQLADRYAVESVMTFGGEPLLYADTVCRIHAAARDCGIPIRQIITNGFFSRSEQKINEVAAALHAADVNHILLSVDAFHQEYIPIEPVVRFAESLLKNNIPDFRVHPAWLINAEHQNPYNEETRRLRGQFCDMGIEISEGNCIFPAGNARKYLSEYFPSPESVDLTVPCGQMPYTSRLDEIENISIDSNGDLTLCSFPIGNIYKNDVLSILDNYDPYENPMTRALIKDGAAGLLHYAEQLGVSVDTSDCYSACGACRKILLSLA